MYVGQLPNDPLAIRISYKHKTTNERPLTIHNSSNKGIPPTKPTIPNASKRANGMYKVSAQCVHMCVWYSYNYRHSQ